MEHSISPLGHGGSRCSHDAVKSPDPSEIEDFGKPHSEPPSQIKIYELHNGRLERLAHEVHTGLAGGSAAFPDVAGATTGHHVGPFICPALNLWNDVVYGEIARRKFPSAVLAHMGITDQDVLREKGTSRL